MEKYGEGFVNNYSHAVSVVERKSIYINGVSKIVSFDDEEFLMETSMGFVVVKGEGLEMVKFDTKDGVVVIRGLIISYAYIEDLKKGSKDSIFTRLFR